MSALLLKELLKNVELRVECALFAPFVVRFDGKSTAGAFVQWLAPRVRVDWVDKFGRTQLADLMPYGDPAPKRELLPVFGGALVLGGLVVARVVKR